MKVYLEQAEIDRLEEQALYLRDRLLIRLLSRLGCRVSEALALKARDIDFNCGMVTIQHLKEHFKLACPKCQARLGRTHKFCPGCGSEVGKPLSKLQQARKLRRVPLDNETLEMLKDFIPIDGTSEFIFGISRHRAWEIIRECARKAGVSNLINPETGKLKGISPHRLRDAFAVHAVQVDDSGDGLRMLQEHLGHQSITTTMRYRKVSGEEHKEWYQKLWQNRQQ
ncbi:MAG: tyrosine-type recombinase/integrase [Dehalococcoidales bacterium]|nr:tyrosine-type recombinase/integrase [Dehalococcoidales bacterium]